MDWENQDQEFNEDEIEETQKSLSQMAEWISPQYRKRSEKSGERRAFGHLWLISYSDFMTILMIFFLGLFGYAHLTKEMIKEKKPKSISYSEFTKLMTNLKTELGDQIEVNDSTSRVTLKLSDAVLFASGQNTLGKNARRTIADLANSIKLVEGQIIVEGHSDNIPISKGPFKTNWELSVARAFSVIHELTKNGVDQARLSAWGYGENRPLVTNSTREGRIQNRRIEIVLLKKIESKKGEV